MRLFVVAILSAVLANFCFAQSHRITHVVTLAGLNQGEGRYIRSDLFENNQFKSGYYFCAGANSTIYNMEYFFAKNYQPFHMDHLTRFSICQDETMAHCQEFATDKYQTLGNINGQLKNDSIKNSVDVSLLREAFQSCEPDPKMDELVKRSIHLDERRFAHVG